MEVVVTSTEMRACDRFIVRKLKIPSIVLMENAGGGTVDVIERDYGSLKGKSAIIFCGKGNNGGDGLVVARHMVNRGTSVTVVLVGKAKELKHDARVNYIAIKNLEKKVASDRLHLIELKGSRALKMLPETDFVIDAIFGTNFSGKLKGMYGDVINWINDSKGITVSIDVPSGVNSDNGAVEQVAVRADLTVTMLAKKIGLIIGDAMDYVGKLEVTDIGVSEEIVDTSNSMTYIVGAGDVRKVLPKRSIHAHKHSVGKIFILAGSRGLTGAAAMTAASAMRAGAGAVILGTPESIYPVLAKKLTEVMVEPLAETSEGTLSVEAYQSIRKHIHWSDLVIIGPGISTHAQAKELFWKIVKECEKPLLLDADGLNILSEKVDLLKKFKSREIILTPHTGELSRLIGISSGRIEENRVEVARQTAKKFNVTVVLKGAPTVTASEEGEIFINSTGNPGMATAGAGDVLAGFIGGLWVLGMRRITAAYSGVYLHGHAGDLAKQQFGERGLMAMDILDLLPQSIVEVESVNLR